MKGHPWVANMDGKSCTMYVILELNIIIVLVMQIIVFWLSAILIVLKISRHNFFPLQMSIAPDDGQTAR
jgi:hypothetical protein